MSSYRGEILVSSSGLVSVRVYANGRVPRRITEQYAAGTDIADVARQWFGAGTLRVNRCGAVTQYFVL